MSTQKDTTAKLADVEARMKRWQTRLNRSVNALNKLERQRRRLQQQIGRPPNPAFVMEVPLPTRTMADRTADQKALRQLNEAVQRMDAEPIENLDIPPFLQREAVDVDKLKAQRKSKEEADKHKMPLTGRAALDAIKPKRKAKA